MNNPRIYHLRDAHNHVLARAEVTFDLQQNVHNMEVQNITTKETIHFQYDNPTDVTRYIKLGIIELNIHGYDHFIEEAMPV